MSDGRALLTDRERKALENDESGSYRYKTRSYLRNRIDKLEADAELLAEEEPELFERLQAAVDVSPVDAAGAGGPDGGTPPDSDGADRRSTDTAPAGDSTEQLVERVVDDVAAAWDVDDRLEDRKAAAVAVVSYAVESGDHVGKSDAVNRFLPEYDVDGQNEESWWRQNARAVLTEVGEYSAGRGGYHVDEAALRAYLEDDS